MPDDFDPVKWFEGQQKKTAPQQPVKSAGDFDPVAWFEGRAKPQQQRPPATVLPQDRQTFNRPRGLGIENVTGVRPQQPQSLGTAKNLGLGVEQEAYGSIAPSVISGLEAAGAALTGDFGPLKETGELTLREGAGLLMGGNPSFARAARSNEQAIQRIESQRQARRAGDPVYGAIEKARQAVEAEAALDPSLRGRALRGVGQAAAMAGMAAVPIPLGGATRAARGLRGRAATRALPEAVPTQRIATPEVRPTSRLPQANNYTVETAPTSSIPQTARLPVRERFDEMPQLVEAEARPFGVREASAASRQPGATGPRFQTELNAQLANQQAQAALQSPTASVVAETASTGRAVGGASRVASQALRTLRTSFDLSAPLSQGAFLTISHPLKSSRAFGRMIRSLSKKQSAAIDDEILNHPLRELGEKNGLYLATGGPPEEAFMLKALNKVPGIGASERTYRTYLDSLRLSTWESYVKSLQASGAAPKAYKDAAAFINITTGRGSLKAGGKLEQAMALGGDILFAPRLLVSRFQMLDPVRYATLAPGARRLVLRDASIVFGSILGTAALLQQAGARVSFDPESDDFLTARSGNHRYDLTAGLKPQVQFLARMVAGTYRQASGEGNLPGKDPLSVAGRYGRSKLGPGPGLVFDSLKGTDFKGESFSDKSAGKIARETVAPMIVGELYEGFEDSGATGLAKSAPSFLGQRVSTYPDRAKADWLNEPEGFRQKGEKRMLLEPGRADKDDKASKDETPQAFATRRTSVNEMFNKYGRGLLDSDAYKRASAEEKTAARDYLRRAIRRKDVNPGSLDPLAIMGSVRESAYQKKAKR